MHVASHRNIVHMDLITVQSSINAPLDKVWQYWTSPEHIMNWNFASPDWHCPNASNDLVTGGEFHYLMAAKDQSFEFDFWGTYTNIDTQKSIEIILGDQRKMFVSFEINGNCTVVTEMFEPEQVNSPDLQRAGWQSILDNFKKYVES